MSGSFGEIRITRLDPETTVAWEGEAASGTVRLEPSGWGTRVVLTARPLEVAEPDPKPEPFAEAPAGGLLARLLARLRRGRESEPPPAAPRVRSEAPSPAPETAAALLAALESLGQAHHRPYSRA